MSVGLRTLLSHYVQTPLAQHTAEVQQFLANPSFANREYHVSAIFNLYPALSTMKFGFIYPRFLISLHTKNKSTTQEDEHYYRHVINVVVVVIIIIELATHLLNWYLI